MKRFSREYFTGVIQSLDDAAIKFICECVKNVISVNFFSYLNPKQKHKFLGQIEPNRKLILHLCKRKNSYKPHRKIIAQKGYGFIIPILTAVLPLIASLLAK